MWTGKVPFLSLGLSFLFHKWRELSWVSEGTRRPTNGHPPVLCPRDIWVSEHISSELRVSCSQLQLARNKTFVTLWSDELSDLFQLYLIYANSGPEFCHFSAVLEEKWKQLICDSAKQNLSGYRILLFSWLMSGRVVPRTPGASATNMRGPHLCPMQQKSFLISDIC